MGAYRPSATATFGTLPSPCFLQFGKPAFRLKLTPLGIPERNIIREWHLRGHGSAHPGKAEDIRLVVDTIPGLVWSTRPDGSAEFFNQRWLEYTGLSAEQALDWGWKVAIHPDDLPRMLETFHEALNLGRSFDVEGRFRRWDGEFRWFLFRGSPLLDGSGKVVKWYGTNTDLEDRKRAEDALRDSEQSFRLIVDGIAGLVAIMSTTGEVELIQMTCPG